METSLAFEKIWFDKFKYDEAEQHYYEYLAKVSSTHHDKNHRINICRMLTLELAVKTDFDSSQYLAIYKRAQFRDSQLYTFSLD